MQGMLGIRDGVLRTSGKTNPSTRDFITFSGRGQTQDAIVGGPKEIADKLEEMFVGRGCDGFVIAATYRTGLLRRFRHACRAGIAAARPVSQGLCRQDPARKSRAQAAAGRRLENRAARRGGIRREARMRWLKFTADGKTSWGLVEGDRVVAVDGDPFGEHSARRSRMRSTTSRSSCR